MQTSCAVLETLSAPCFGRTNRDGWGFSLAVLLTSSRTHSMRSLTGMHCKGWHCSRRSNPASTSGDRRAHRLRSTVVRSQSSRGWPRTPLRSPNRKRKSSKDTASEVGVLLLCISLLCWLSAEMRQELVAPARRPRRLVHLRNSSEHLLEKCDRLSGARAQVSHLPG
jgi:hypothetical protein